MDTPILTWTVTVSLLLAFTVIKTFGNMSSRNGRRRRLLEIGSERDEFYVPGDITNAEDYEDEEF